MLESGTSKQPKSLEGVVKTMSNARRLKDYALVGKKLTQQRIILFSAAIALAAYYYDAKVAFGFLLATALFEVFDGLLFHRILKSPAKTPHEHHRIMQMIFVMTFLSSTTIALFCISIAVQQGTQGNHFLPVFLLVSASIFAAMNNHQFMSVLMMRLGIYIGAILFIPIRDVWIETPPLNSEIWLNLFTTMFVLGFLIELSRTFLTGYSTLMRNRVALRVENKNARAASEAKTRFLATVSHELRTPLTSIKGAMDIIHSGKAGSVPEKMTKLLDMAQRNTNRLHDLVQDLLLLQTSDAGKFSLDVAELDLGATVCNAVDAFESYADKFGVTIDSDIEPDKHFVVGDAKRLDQVIVNLLSNAAKFSEPGAKVRVAITRKGTQLTLSVTDQGIGIPENSEATIFEEFGQIDSSDKRKFQGTGLGLAISKRIVEAHGGTIGYESALGIGTTFKVTLDATKASNRVEIAPERYSSAA
mgnify:CR=1 FL=1